MIFIDNTGITDASINLAIEEYALKHLPMDESYLLFILTAHLSSSVNIKIRLKKSIRNMLKRMILRLCGVCPAVELSITI